jgi:hypothetical protein
MITLGGGGSGFASAPSNISNTTATLPPRSNTFGMVSNKPSFDYNQHSNHQNNAFQINKNKKDSKTLKKASRKRDRWGYHKLNNWRSDSDSSDTSTSSDEGNDGTASQGGPYSADEEARRRRRAGRFKDGTADGVNSSFGNTRKKSSSEKRRAKLSALLDDVGAAGEDIDWNQFAIKVINYLFIIVICLVLSSY